MDFCHISPTQYLRPLDIINTGHTHLLLAHLIEQDAEYTKYYAENKTYQILGGIGSITQERTYIMDNSAYELYRAGLPMFDASKLIELATQVHANYIVLPDYPSEDGSKTIKAAEQWAPIYKQKRFGTFFVPQSRIGDLEGYIAAFAWAASSPLVDYIGMSILGIPNAYGVDGNDIQRFVSRWAMFHELDRRGLLELAKNNKKKIHCLGMTDGPNEVALLAEFFKDRAIIDTWDSSSAVWAGINGISYDRSPTGLIDGKVKSHVDFSMDFSDTYLHVARDNIRTITKLKSS